MWPLVNLTDVLRKTNGKATECCTEEGEILKDDKTSRVMKDRARKRGIMASVSPDAKAIRRFRTKPYPNRTVNDTLKKWGVDMSAKVSDGQKIT